MPRFFNTAGPCRPGEHYMLPAAVRVPEVREIVERGGYFVLHAPRQTGKTTALLQLAQDLTAEGRYAACLLSVETGAPFADDPATAETAILSTWRDATQRWLPAELRPLAWPEGTSVGRLGSLLAAWARTCPRPLVLFLDEIDALRDEAMISVLRQLRGGYPTRPEGFPWSIGLVGLRDVRDYVVASGGSGRLGTASPFNVKVVSLRLGDFDEADVEALLGQHTEDTGQPFEPAAVARIWDLSRGQPWLVNALAAQLVDRLVRDRSVPIGVDAVDAARDELIRRQDTHLDSLVERLREDRVRAIVAPMLSGETAASAWPLDDVRYVEDLGLVRRGSLGTLEIANPIYREVVARLLAEPTRVGLPPTQPVWMGPDGRLDPARTLDAFLAFWRRHGEALLRSASYPEIAPHLVLLAWLDRVANGGGRVEREYAIGSGRMDVLLERGDVRMAFELKVWRDGQRDPLAEGLEQMDAYLGGLGLHTGWLVIFDTRSGRPPIDERTSAEAARTAGGRTVTVIRA
jgi:hypothetical protein